MSEAAETKRTYKDSLFRMIFQDREALLSLYNAINGTCYDQPEELIITTLEDAIYLGWKNDVSFLIQDVLSLYEHQSTKNPNMPLRGLFYISSLFRGYLKENELDPYSSALLKLPTPRYIVFYNGTQEEPDRMELRLSDSFIRKEDEPCIECKALVLNINYGHNQELMGACRKLYEYAYFIQKVRDFLEEGLIRDAAIDRAVIHCIEADVLKDFLSRHRAEVKDLFLTEYDEKLHEQTLKEEGRMEGVKQGIEQGIKQGIEQGIKQGIEQGIKRGIEQGIKQGIGQGIEQGELKRAKEMAAAMLKDGMAPDKVKKYSELSEEQWDEFLKSLPD